MTDGVRKLNKFGKGEFAGASVDDDNGNKGDGDVQLNLACINWEDAKDDDDEWCRVCYDTDEEDQQHGNVVVNVDINNDDIVLKEIDELNESQQYDHLIEEVFTNEMDIEQWDDNEGFALLSIILTNLKSIPSRSQILMNPNVLIVDTGSTDKTTGSMLGAFYVRHYNGLPTKTATNEDMVIKAKFEFKGIITD